MAGSDSSTICKHNQRGFCKYGERCRMRHINEICSKESCKGGCNLRHPPRCRYFVLNGVCKFSSSCAYRHDDSPEKLKIEQLEKDLKDAMERFKVLEKVVEDFSIKLIEEKIEPAVRLKPTQQLD